MHTYTGFQVYYLHNYTTKMTFKTASQRAYHVT